MTQCVKHSPGHFPTTPKLSQLLDVEHFDEITPWLVNLRPTQRQILIWWMMPMSLQPLLCHCQPTMLPASLQG